MIVAMSSEEDITYKVDFKHQLKSLRYCLLIGIILLISTLIICVASARFILDFKFIEITSLFIIFFLLPVFYLHITYYLRNRNTCFSITENSTQYLYSDNEKKLSFKLKDIDVIEQHLGIYHENNVDFVGHRVAPWTNYHYIKIKLRNGDSFFLTSLMVDYKSFPMHIYNTKFRFIPYLK